MGQFQIVDFDGAETLVDFGSGAPGGAFVKTVVTSGVEVRSEKRGHRRE